MEYLRPQSIYQDIKSRELNGLKVRKRPYFSDSFEAPEPKSDAVSSRYIPLALSFCKTSKSAHIIAVSDQDGYVSLFNSRSRFISSATHVENAEKSRVANWFAHDNAVFDVCWIKEDTSILTASADHSIKVWDVQKNTCTGVLTGHSATVKSLSSHPSNSDLFVSGSRDGSFAQWDLRCKPSEGRNSITPTSVTKKAHVDGKHTRRRRAAPVSITSVLCLKDDLCIATAGAADSIIKIWDTRNLKCSVIQTFPYPDSAAVDMKRRRHGITSLSQDLNGLFLSASCMDNRIYLYNLHKLDKGPVNSYAGCNINSFFIKSAISPDASHILSGSVDGDAYIWQVNRPDDPIVLESHEREVTSVDWCLHELGKIATSSDDYTVRFWDIFNSFCTSETYPPSFRRKTGPSRVESARLIQDRDNEEPSVINSRPSEEDCDMKTPEQAGRAEMRTPESQKNKLLPVNLMDTLEKLPEFSLQSPSSVLNPPSSSKKRTIRDYFLASA